MLIADIKNNIQKLLQIEITANKVCSEKNVLFFALSVPLWYKHYSVLSKSLKQTKQT